MFSFRKTTERERERKEEEDEDHELLSKNTSKSSDHRDFCRPLFQLYTVFFREKKKKKKKTTTTKRDFEHALFSCANCVWDFPIERDGCF